MYMYVHTGYGTCVICVCGISYLCPQALSRQLVHTQQMADSLQARIEHHQRDATEAMSALNILAESYARLHTTLNQTLTRLAVYEGRMVVQTKRLAAVKGTESNTLWWKAF